jgi:hypothetical protein
MHGDIFAHRVEPEHLNFKLPISILQPVQPVLALIAGNGGESDFSLNCFNCRAGNRDAIRSHHAGLGLGAAEN